MADSKSIPQLCRNAVIQLGKVGLVFLISLLLFALLTLFQVSTPLRAIDAIVLLISGVWVSVRLLRFLSRNCFWSLRNRLLTVYGLLGVLPIVLILVLVGLCAWALMSELAIYLVTSELDRRLSYIHGAAKSLEKTPVESRKYAGPEILGYFKVDFPTMILYSTDPTGTHTYPPDAAPLELPEGWQTATGLLQRDGRFYGWSHIVDEKGSITALVPLSDDFVADLVPNLGQIVLAETPHRSGGSDSLTLDTAGPRFNPDINFKKGRAINKNTGRAEPHFALHNAGRLPPPVNKLDIGVNWFAAYPHYDWQDPNKKHAALLMVRSRPSAVLSAIFTGTDQSRSILVTAMTTVAILFLIVEIVATFIGISLSRRITRAVNELYEGTRRVIYGDFRHRIPVRGHDQVAELTTSFNQMTGNLERLLSVEKEKERLQAELEIAREVQTQLYPQKAPPPCGLRITVYCEPARVVSGDYYDYATVPTKKLAFAIGDVAGKGISAALLMATVQAALRAQLSVGLDNNGPDSSPAAARLVSELNRQLYAHTAPEKYATFFFGMYDQTTATLSYTNAGHLPPILIRKGLPATLDINGTVVGAFPFSQYDESRLELEPGDLLICYTDGITEPENAYGEMFGEQRLIELVTKSAHEDDQVIIRKVIEAVRSWHTSPELSDDMTLLIARRLGPEAA